ncbi:deoxyribose-phosphate aldolase [Christiangramia forsetii]|uniref:Deoxyribose-phosphate aldolase n=2 Tax=Christiangramia forsetii TaxID=411153 RepID=A0M194_CHRFK|nr:deoxyribose-phosphate aldolase [Christiangramia forsetii]GGG43062.1 deoxyribose-phosphate aldolase [Christiangramia forsetii]CAL66389.1 deoxyribose-phosphate aldolase-1 [Christiangramia forsetii KT0803]
MQLNHYIDHTLLAAHATTLEIKKLCREAIEHKFYAVCVNSSRVKNAKEILEGSKVQLAVTIGFPLGASSTASKTKEAETAIAHGADEIDMVMNIGFLKDGKSDLVQAEIEKIKMAIGDKILKVIIETCYLSEDEIRFASNLVMRAGADFVKTSTGFGSRGASLKDVKIMKEMVGDQVKIKASGGIRDAETARKYIKLGVARIGTSSGIKIVS